MPANMIFCGRVDKLIISLFYTDVRHFGTASVADWVVESMRYFFDRQIAHPFIVSALLLAFMLRNGDGLCRLSFFFAVSEH